MNALDKRNLGKVDEIDDEGCRGGGVAVYLNPVKRCWSDVEREG